MKIKGKIISGDKVGQYFMSLDVYKPQFQEKVGFDPFPGTLNLEVDEETVSNIHKLDSNMEIIKGKGNYGDVKILPAIIQHIKGAFVFPVKTHHQPTIIEFIAPLNLRKALKLEDEDMVTIEV